jgi:hypothetical protein
MAAAATGESRARTLERPRGSPEVGCSHFEQRITDERSRIMGGIATETTKAAVEAAEKAVEMTEETPRKVFSIVVSADVEKVPNTASELYDFFYGVNDGQITADFSVVEPDTEAE